MAIHFLVGVVFSLALSAGIAAYTGLRNLWFWFILLQAVSLLQTLWNWLYEWLVWKMNRKKVVAKFLSEFKAIGFPPFTHDEFFIPMAYLDQVTNSSSQTNEVRQLAHQIIVVVRTMNDFKKTTERERYLEAVGEAILQIPSQP